MEPTKLAEWMKQHRWSDPAFAAEVSKHLKKPITARAVFKWRHRERVPRPAAQRAIAIVTNGEVTANDLMGLP